MVSISGAAHSDLCITFQASICDDQARGAAWPLLLCDIVSRDSALGLTSDNVSKLFESFYSISSDLMAVSMCRVLSKYGGPL